MYVYTYISYKPFRVLSVHVAKYQISSFVHRIILYYNTQYMNEGSNW